MRACWLCLELMAVLSLGRASAQPLDALAWDTAVQRYEAKRGETNAFFLFHFRNSSTNGLTIQAVRSVCHCTVPRIAAELPWTLEAGAEGLLEVNVDLRNRWDPFKQNVFVESSVGTNVLWLEIKPAPLTTRERNRLVAFTDRQAVFKGDCAKCHLAPSLGKSVEARYDVLCGTCHEARERAEMVPALTSGKRPHDRSYWDEWVRKGKPGTFMPAFAKRYGGPLTDPELAALLDFLTKRFD